MLLARRVREHPSAQPSILIYLCSRGTDGGFKHSVVITPLWFDLTRCSLPSACVRTWIDVLCLSGSNPLWCEIAIAVIPWKISVECNQSELCSSAESFHGFFQHQLRSESWSGSDKLQKTDPSRFVFAAKQPHIYISKWLSSPPRPISLTHLIAKI